MPLRLALVEDHAALRRGLELLLAHSGCEVVGSAAGAEDGWELVRAQRPDVVVIDVLLGEGSGIELARRVVSGQPDSRVVLYTGSTDVELLYRGLDSGALGYALKEGGADELMEAIEAVAAGHTYVDPRLRAVLRDQRPLPPRVLLTAREREVVQLLADGLTNDEVAERLFLSAETVKTHLRNATAKLGARNRVHAIALALQRGEIRLDAASVP